MRTRSCASPRRGAPQNGSGPRARDDASRSRSAVPARRRLSRLHVVRASMHLRIRARRRPHRDCARARRRRHPLRLPRRPLLGVEEARPLVLEGATGNREAHEPASGEDAGASATRSEATEAPVATLAVVQAVRRYGMQSMQRQRSRRGLSSSLSYVRAPAGAPYVRLGDRRRTYVGLELLVVDEVGRTYSILEDDARTYAELEVGASDRRRSFVTAAASARGPSGELSLPSRHDSRPLGSPRRRALERDAGRCGGTAHDEPRPPAPRSQHASSGPLPARRPVGGTCPPTPPSDLVRPSCSCSAGLSRHRSCNPVAIVQTRTVSGTYRARVGHFSAGGRAA